MTVNALRKSSTDDEVITLAKFLIKTWKKLLSGKGGDDKKSADSPNGSGPKESSPPATGSSRGPMSIPKQTSFPTDTNNVVRLKCREMLANALKAPDMPEGCEEPEDLAAKIEDHILLSHLRLVASSLNLGMEGYGKFIYIQSSSDK
ncbi:TCEA1 [Cordylochernes scorpioides]|uniref:TCEA1 n=1 Tax=Cordylochernes scorpioides TaxID=51811 RepID=A0ABY6L788_9ARAC|nr:TCEA1 [Cordylochernes scorpioides]